MVILKRTINKKLDKICIVKRNDKEIETVYLSDKKDESESGFLEMELDPEFKFQLVPNTNKERDVLFIGGSSGSGKSWMCKEYLKQYIKLYPKNAVYLFSYLQDDVTIDEVKKIQRIDIYDKDFLNEELDPKEFENSIVVMDDCDCIDDKKLKNKILAFFKKLCFIGRHHKITVCWLAHDVVSGHETKSILNECTSISIFPKGLGSKKIHYLLDNYFGLSKEEVERIKRIDSRCVTIMKTYPKVVLSEREIYIL